MSQASRIIEQFDSVSGITVTLMQVIFNSGGVQYYAKAERIDEPSETYELLWADWFLSLARAQARIDALEI
jgi:hypothetical protein